MRFLIYIPIRSRYAPPRVGNFYHNEEFGRYLYKGRPLEASELNAAAADVFEKPNRFITQIPTIEVIEIEESSTSTEGSQEGAHQFSIKDGIVYDGEDSIARIADDRTQLRMENGKGELREAVLEWLQSNSPTTETE
ncbi:hypothetical protein JIN85_14670 [Luteolibacter pohnpeiensis]|uniref:Uncharacterized protein n=1 Tax=Luteolibacter pohnpeiensis TaxID=454153 RepID=A0A934SCK8_9BACT|nr:hypothetical protein [Luteolibacter pohnpeiensis]MBK1883662.1 hypothetical protein [Luteolibacter pohnpeiensis]